MKLDDDGKSRGMAVVQMDNPLEAIQAISMFGNQLLFDRKINVRMDRYDGNEPKKGETERKQRGGIPEGLKNIGLGLGAGGTVVNIGRLLDEQRQQQSMMSSMSGLGSMGGMGGMSGAMGSMGGMGSPMGGMGSMSSAPMSMMTGSMGMNTMAGMGGMGSSLGGNGGGFGGGSGGGMSSLGDRGMSEMRGMSADRMGGPRDNLGVGMSGMGGMSGMSALGGGSMGMSDFSRAGAASMGGMRDFPGASGPLGDMRNSAMSAGLGVLGSGGPGILDSFHRQNPGGMMSGGGDRGGSGGRGGGGGGGGRDTGKGGDPDCSVFVRNLPFSVNWQDLKDKFRCVGDVRYAEIKQKDGKSMGCGVVRFGSKDEAQKAIELFDRTRVEGREIEVRMDRVN